MNPILFAQSVGEPATPEIPDAAALTGYAQMAMSAVETYALPVLGAISIL